MNIRCIENVLSLIQFSLLSQNWHVILRNKKTAFCLKRNIFRGPQNQLFRLKMGRFFSSRIRELGGILQTWVRVWMYALVGSGRTGIFISWRLSQVPGIITYNFGRYVRLSVCLSVSLSVLSSITHERFDISSPNLIDICNGSAVPVSNIDK